MSVFDDEERRLTRTPPAVAELLEAAAHLELRPRRHGRVLRSGPERLLEATRAVLAEREAELLELLGPCRNAGRTACPLHLAHRGPCAPPTAASLARRDAAAALDETLERASRHAARMARCHESDDQGRTL